MQTEKHPFDSLQACASQAAPAVTAHLDFEGYRIELRFSSEAAADFFSPALAHRLAPGPVGAAVPDFTLMIGDGASAGLPQPEFPFRLDELGPGGAVPLPDFPEIRFAYDAESALIQTIDASRHLGFVWAKDLAGVRPNHRGAPLLHPLRWILAPAGRHIWHAAAVGDASGAVLLAGQGGSGKSTTALAALGGGLDYLGDDYCLVESAELPRVSSLYSSGKADAASLRRLGFLDAEAAIAIDQVPTPKSLFFFHPQFADQIPRQRPIRSIIIPEVAHVEEPHLEPISSGRALLKLAPSTLFQLTHSDRGAFAFMSETLQALPCQRLMLSGDTKANTRLIAKHLQEYGKGEP